MPYDENSFLQGVAVGRSLKGISVINTGESGIVSIAGSTMQTGQMVHYYADMPPGDGGTVAITYLSIDIAGERIETVVAVPAQLGLGAILAGAVMEPQPIRRYSAAQMPQTMGANYSAEAIITIDE